MRVLGFITAVPCFYNPIRIFDNARWYRYFTARLSPVPV